MSSWIKLSHPLSSRIKLRHPLSPWINSRCGRQVGPRHRVWKPDSPPGTHMIVLGIHQSFPLPNSNVFSDSGCARLYNNRYSPVFDDTHYKHGPTLITHCCMNSGQDLQGSQPLSMIALLYQYPFFKDVVINLQGYVGVKGGAGSTKSSLAPRHWVCMTVLLLLSTRDLVRVY